jgi:hypothetical protein
VKSHGTFEIIDSVRIDALGNVEFSVMSPSLEPGMGYYLDFYADMNENGYYDVPPADHAWRIEIPTVAADTFIHFEHNTNFSDIDEEPTSVIDVSGNSDFGIYPNPAESYLKLMFSDPEIKEVYVRVYNASGSIVINKLHQVSGNEVLVKLDKVKPGFYFIEARSDKGNYTSKFIKK